MSLDTVRNRIWLKIRYQFSTTNCGNCAHSQDWSKDKQKGKCSALAGCLFDILWHGICKLHSAFNGANLKRS